MAGTTYLQVDRRAKLISIYFYKINAQKVKMQQTNS